VDQGIRVLSVGGVTVPSFWVGLLLLLVLARGFGWAPPLEFVSPWRDPAVNLQQMVWPVAIVAYRSGAVLTRMMRSSTLEVLREDYVRTARAKGLPGTAVVVRHAVRNALLPVLTLAGLEFAFLLGGTVTTEVVFNLNGLGRLLVDAITRRDYPVIQALVVLAAVVYTVINLAVDLLYGWVDPRVSQR
jgi:peptide/nickel transport system permease protein